METHFVDKEFTFQAWIKNPVVTTVNDGIGQLLASHRVGTVNDSLWNLGLELDAVGGNQRLVVSMPGWAGRSSNLVFEEDVWYLVAITAKGRTDDPALSDLKIYFGKEGDAEVQLVGDFQNSKVNWGASGSGAYNHFALGGNGLINQTSHSTHVQPRRFDGYMDDVMYSNAARSKEYFDALMIPEPSVAALALPGMALFWLLRRRR